MEDRQRLEELVGQINLYQGQLDLLKQQIETVKVSLSEFSLVEETLDSIKGQENAETLVPIGAGSFLIAELKNTDEVIVGIGADVAVKKKIEDAKKSIEEQKGELENLMNKMVTDMQKLTDAITKISPEAEELYKKVQSQG